MTVNQDFQPDYLLNYGDLLPPMLADGVRVMIYIGLEVISADWSCRDLGPGVGDVQRHKPPQQPRAALDRCACLLGADEMLVLDSKRTVRIANFARSAVRSSAGRCFCSESGHAMRETVADP